ncbi:unnamed protein product [Nyctereutes procyonoides]|uniref:(raccoon dog) hypothetical protein n=1 Tax=Nyctereutes procyonoides TaxID=34880 RepID=A0A811Y7D9_NYCPR|nr:unnamed protein product [Nyctereutes procyonoides]
MFQGPETIFLEAYPLSRPKRMASNIFRPTEEGKEVVPLMPIQIQRLNPPGNIFGSPVTATLPLAHPNKPKDHMFLCEGGDPKSQPMPRSIGNSHKPGLGPSSPHNKVLNLSGGKSSISLYKESAASFVAKQNSREVGFQT